jgi:hypothetical protein
MSSGKRKFFPGFYERMIKSVSFSSAADCFDCSGGSAGPVMASQTTRTAQAEGYLLIQ